MRKLHSRVCPWLTENPQADFAELETVFGTPEAIAAAYLDEMPPEEILIRLSQKRQIVVVLVIAVFAAVAVWTAILTAISVDLSKDVKNGITYIYPVQQEGTEEPIS